MKTKKKISFSSKKSKNTQNHNEKMLLYKKKSDLYLISCEILLTSEKLQVKIDLSLLKAFFLSCCYDDVIMILLTIYQKSHTHLTTTNSHSKVSSFKCFRSRSSKLSVVTYGC